MIAQLRIYTVNKGKMEHWLEVFHSELTPLLHEHGIRVESAWVDEHEEQFIWIRSFHDREDLAAKEAAFYASEWWDANRTKIRSMLARREIRTIAPAFD